MTVRRYPLGGLRELRTNRVQGKVFLAIHVHDGLPADPRHKGLVLEDAELDTLRSALADLAGETPQEPT
ncbi:MAG TPA: hypothetical protein VHO06_13855 [Polyangia bacterium]|nr:hypothetical protein [Polyangia bacterium]